MTELKKTTCCYCGVGCGISVAKDPLGKLQLFGDESHPVNKGMLCSKGMNLHYTVMDQSDRLRYPEMRYHKSLPRQRVSWDQALERTAAVFSTFIKKFGPDSVAFYVSGQLLTEEYYVANKLMKGFIGSNNIDSNSRLCMSSAVAAYKMALGEDCVPGCYEDLELADCIFISGANPAWCHPILWRRIEAAKALNPNMKIIVSDPRVTQTCHLADIHLQIKPGTDITLHFVIGRLLIENGDIDLDFIKNHTEGLDAYWCQVMRYSVQEAAAICGVSVFDIQRAARFIGCSKGFVSAWTMGLNQSVIGVHKNLSLINLHLITGKIGKPGSGPFSLTGQPNAMGGREVGGLANLLAAHKNLESAVDRDYMQTYWGGVQLSDKRGYTATQMFEALNDGRLKAIWIMGTNPLVSLPDVRMAEEGLRKARFVVVQEISNKPETLAYADVLLPAASWLEKEGTMTNSERRITYLEQVTTAPGEALPDARILCRFAQKMGFSGFDYPDAAAIYEEHVRLTEGTNMDISGLDYGKLKEKRSVQWPYPKGETGLGTARLFVDNKFHTPSKKAIIHSFDDENKSEELTPAYPLILTTGRIRDQWHTMSKTGKVNKLKRHIDHAFLEMNPEDAGLRNLKDDVLVVVRSKRGEVRVKVKITDNVRSGVVFLPMHWGRILKSDLNRANNLTSNLVDPVSSEPDFKFAAVQVEPYIKPHQKIVVIGAGAGAYGFISSYRKLNTEDDIEVFCKEIYPFYNRVMLPDYISGTQSWDQLVQMKETEQKRFGLNVHCGVWIEAIDREKKQLTDSNGDVHSYDLLILATGSRASVIKDLPGLKGLFTMRTRVDADRFCKHVLPGKEAVIIVGGGLLGIEMAASLTEMAVKVCIIHRSSRLMDKQLDVLGSQLLYEELKDKNIDVFFNDEIERILGSRSVEGITLRSGHKMDCQAILFAVGTTPNKELASSCGLDTNRGVIVNEYLRSSDPDIYAIGEIAEFNGSLYGIAAAAQQQAGIAAKYINGDIAHYYEGTISMNILKMHGTALCSLGLTTAPAGDSNYEEVLFIDKAKRYYKKCIIYNDRLIGAILIGDKTEFQEYKELIQNKIELSEKRLELLRSGKAAAPVLGKLICSCGNVGEGNILAKIEEGSLELKSLCAASGAGQGCGSCVPEVQLILEKHLKKEKIIHKMIEASS